MIDLTPIANAVITLVALLITAFLIPWLKAKIAAEKLEDIKKWVTIAVQAAEMIYESSDSGPLKKTYVKNYLNARGYDIDWNSLNVLIESAVLEMKQKEPVKIVMPPIGEGTETENTEPAPDDAVVEAAVVGEGTDTFV